MSDEPRSQFRPKELAIVLSHYDVGPINEIHSFRRGNPRAPKCKVVADKGTFLLKRRAPGLNDPYRVALAHDVQLYLIGHQFTLPRLIGTQRSHSTMLKTPTAVYELFEFIEGDPYDGSESATGSAGQTLQRFHALMQGYEPAYEAPALTYHNSEAVRKSIQDVAPSISTHDSVSGQQAELQSLSVELLNAYEQAAADVNRTIEPAGELLICHGDWHPGNLLFRDGKVIAGFDFDTVRIMRSLEDVANGCLQFSLVARGAEPNHWPDHMDVRRAQWFLGGYRGDDPWPENELEGIGALMVEALIAEAVTPIAQTGRFAHIQGFRFLKMIARKVGWLQQNTRAALIPS